MNRASTTSTMKGPISNFYRLVEVSLDELLEGRKTTRSDNL